MTTSSNTTLRWLAKKILPKNVVNTLRTLLPESVYYPGYGHTTLNDTKIKNIVSLLEECLSKKLEGNAIECGVFRGGSLTQMGLVMKQLDPQKRLFGVDTFEGHPFNTDEDKPENGHLVHKQGLFSSNQLEKVQEILHQKNLQNVVLCKGLVENVLQQFSSEKFFFSHLDLDLYLSTKQALSFIAPRIVPSGIIVFDDYGDPDAPGVKKAVDEILGGNSLTITLSSKGGYQAFWKNNK